MFLDDLVARCHANLPRYPEAVEYLKNRFVTDDDIKAYRLGYSKVVTIPDDGHPDYKRFMGETHKGRDFEAKIILPMMDGLDRVMGIAGRAVASKEFKTFITSEANFCGFFFGLYQALPYIYSSNRVYTVEGWFDEIAMRKALPNTVATGTSGISEQQYEYLRFYCDQVVTCFDSDKAGEMGRERAERLFNTMSFNLGYKDPAKCLEMLGLQKFKAFVTNKAKVLPPF